MLKKNFKQLSKNFSPKKELINQLWIEIENAHNNPKRYYHTLKHLANIDKERQNIKLSFEDNAIFQFATYYHDIVYDIEAKDNEEQSATIAQERLNQIGVPNYLIDEICKLITLTKTHAKTDKLTYAYFLDADLAILGSSAIEYRQYIKQVRQEYQVYSDEIYYRGRQKVLKNFIKKEEIYQTECFRKRYGKQAQLNIKWELERIN